VNCPLNRLTLYLLPKRTLTAAVAAFARSSLSRFIIPWYIRHYDIDTSDADLPVDAYGSLLGFFCRSLKAGSRPVETSSIVSPVDGVVSEMGRIQEGRLLQAKGCTYSLQALLGDDGLAMKFLNGSYLTLYLSPRDYHRIHMPVDGDIVRWKYIPGNLYPVNQSGVHSIPGLFTKNERLVTQIKMVSEEMALVKVGATIVGSIRTIYGPVFTSTWSRRRRFPEVGITQQAIQKGSEIGRFEFGSTVILLFQPGMSKTFSVQHGERIRAGQALVK